MSPDKVFKQYSKQKPKIEIRVEDDIVFIEGKSNALEMLGKVIIAQSKFDKDCGIQISPNGAGKVFFKRSSTHGIYIHRLPCLDKKNKK